MSSFLSCIILKVKTKFPFHLKFSVASHFNCNCLKRATSNGVVTILVEICQILASHSCFFTILCHCVSNKFKFEICLLVIIEEQIKAHNILSWNQTSGHVVNYLKSVSLNFKKTIVYKRTAE